MGSVTLKWGKDQSSPFAPSCGKLFESGAEHRILGLDFLPDGSAVRPLSGLFVSGVGHAD